MDCLTLVLLVILIVICLTKLFLAYLGIEDIRVDASSPVELESKDENSLVLSKKLRFYNEGKQCATIMDAICRSQLPYEQYDGIEVRPKAEREGEVREDDYFEAVIIQKKGYKGGEDSLNIFAKIKLTPPYG